MKYDVISADGHVDLIWLPPDLFTRNASAIAKRKMSTPKPAMKAPIEATKFQPAKASG